MKQRFLKAYSIAELIITVIIIGTIALVLLISFLRNKQHEYNAKINKTAASINAILEKDIIATTGKTEYSAAEVFELLSSKNNGLLREEECINCWGNNTVNGDNLAADSKIGLKDKTSVAIHPVIDENGNQVDYRIYIDANGSKGPNKFNQDIKLLGSLGINKENGWIIGGICTRICNTGYTLKDSNRPSCYCDKNCKISTCSEGQHIDDPNSTSCSCVANCTLTCRTGETLKDSNSTSCYCDKNCKKTCNTGYTLKDSSSTSCYCDKNCKKTCKTGYTLKNSSSTSCYCDKNCKKTCKTGYTLKNSSSTSCYCDKNCKISTCPDGQHIDNQNSTSCKCVVNCTKTCGTGETLKDSSSTSCYCDKNCKIDSCPTGKKIDNENSTDCKCVCSAAKNPKTKTNATWSDNDCKWTCNPGYPVDRTTACCPTKKKTEYWTSTTGCSKCEQGKLPANASWGTGENICTWTCKNGYYKDGSSCKSCRNAGRNLYNSGNSYTIPKGCKCMVHQGSEFNSGGYKGSYTVGGKSYYVNGYCGRGARGCSTNWFTGETTVVKRSNGNYTGKAYPAMIRDGGGNGKQGLLVVSDCK